MGERTSYAPGTPNWVDLSTQDLEGSKAFYAALLGWDYLDNESAMYSQALVDGKVVAGIYRGESSRPTAWNMYLAVGSADEAAARAVELGGRQALEPFDIPGVGRMAWLEDPQGAFVALMEAKGHIGCQLVNGPGLFSWAELVTTDLEGARAFYGGLFGELEWPAMDLEGGRHYIPSAGGRPVAGVMGVPPGAPEQSYWLAYFGVDDLDRSTSQAGELGGTVMIQPTVISAELGSFSVVSDPQGGMFALYAGEFQE
jgi:predicted enzyme related to lactoylglutathione lyase